MNLINDIRSRPLLFTLVACNFAGMFFLTSQHLASIGSILVISSALWMGWEYKTADLIPTLMCWGGVSAQILGVIAKWIN